MAGSSGWGTPLRRAHQADTGLARQSLRSYESPRVGLPIVTERLIMELRSRGGGRGRLAGHPFVLRSSRTTACSLRKKHPPAASPPPLSLPLFPCQRVDHLWGTKKYALLTSLHATLR